MGRRLAWAGLALCSALASVSGCGKDCTPVTDGSLPVLRPYAVEFTPTTDTCDLAKYCSGTLYVTPRVSGNTLIVDLYGCYELEATLEGTLCEATEPGYPKNYTFSSSHTANNAAASVSGTYMLTGRLTDPGAGGTPTLSGNLTAHLTVRALDDCTLSGRFEVSQ